MGLRGRTSTFLIRITDDDNNNLGKYATKGGNIIDIDLTTIASLPTGKKRPRSEDKAPVTADSASIFYQGRNIPRITTTQQRKYKRSSGKFITSKQWEGEFAELSWKDQDGSMHVSGAPECMKISGFMHGITNPDLIKKLE
ncbi:hypothetical protein Tco_0999994 [Tanacetum coccineum]